MDGMDDLVQFLHDRLDETAARAHAATRGPWTVDNEAYAESISSADGTVVVGGGRWGGEASVFESTEDALHIAEHNPVRVLAEVDAKRQILAIHRRYVDEPGMACLGCAGGIEWELCPVARLLALPYADHPDYRPEWRPGA